MIHLTIKTLDSQDHKFHVPDTFTILELKEHIAEQVKIAVVQQRLIFCGRVMSNETKLADIGIDGKVMHLVQKVPRLATTTSGTSSTTTNTNSRSGQNGGPGFRGWHTHDPTVLFGAIGIPMNDYMSARDVVPRIISNPNPVRYGTSHRLSMGMDMIKKANDILNRLENPGTSGRSTANNVEQLPEGSQQAEETSRNVQLETPAQESSSQESASMPTQPDSDSLNVSYEVDDTFPNTVVVTIDATHHMRMPPGLMRHMQNHLQATSSHSPSQNVAEQSVESEVTSIPEMMSGGSNNQHSTDQASGTALPSTTTSEPNLRNVGPPLEPRTSGPVIDRRRLKELIEQLNTLNVRFEPFYSQYCHYITDDPNFETIEGEHGSHRAQTMFNGISEVMHLISHIYHLISDLRVAFNRPSPRSIQSRLCLLPGIHQTHFTTPAPTQQPTSTQTTSISQSLDSIPLVRVDLLGRVGSESPNVSTVVSTTEINTNMTVDPNTESNNAASEFSTETPQAVDGTPHAADETPHGVDETPHGVDETPHGVELMFDLTPGSFRIDSVEAAFVNPNASGSSQPTAVSQPPSGGQTSNNMSMPIDWMDQMIDVISSGVRRPFMPDQSLDWSIPTTSTRTPRVTPRTTDSSSTTNPPSQGLNRARWDTSPPSISSDYFLPCSSHHFESNLRPVVLSRRSTQGTDRSTPSGNSNSTDTSTPTSPIDVRPISVRRTGRPRTRYMQDPEGFLSGIHPILTWGRNHRNNTATTSASNNTQAAGQGTDIAAEHAAEQIRIGGIESVLDTLEREVDFDRAAGNMRPPTSTIELLTAIAPAHIQSLRDELDESVLMPIGDIPYFRSLEGRYILGDLFLLIARNWTLHDMLNLCTVQLSTIVQHPVSRISDALVDFILDRVMHNLPPTNLNIEAAANRICLEMAPYIHVFQCSVPTRTNIDVNASFRRCVVQNLRALVIYCIENRGGASNDIVASLTIFAEGLLSLIVYCCDNRSVFRLSVGALMHILPFPPNIQTYVVNQVGMNVDHYWDNMTTFQMMSLPVVDFIVPYNSELNGGQTSRVNNEEQSSNSILPSSEIANEPLPEVVIGSQEWHHDVPSEWVPVIARDSQRQRRQGTQPPYSDAYLSGMPNKRRKIVTSSKPQGPLSQIIAKNLEVAMGAAGVAVKKEVTTSVGADTAVQNAYTERIRTFGRSGLDMHPDFSPDRYPNASKFFYDRPN